MGSRRIPAAWAICGNLGGSLRVPSDICAFAILVRKDDWDSVEGAIQHPDLRSSREWKAAADGQLL